jgi:hypothetical protein
MKIAVYDNPATECRECWDDKVLHYSVSHRLLLDKHPIPARFFFLGANVGPFIPGRIIGDREAIGNLIPT